MILQVFVGCLLGSACFLGDPLPNTNVLGNAVHEAVPSSSSTADRDDDDNSEHDDEFSSRLERAQPSVQREQQQLVSNLKMQQALREGRRLARTRRFEEAIRILETQLAAADGSDTYLETLAECYRGRMADLLHLRKVDEAKLIAQRLAVISPEHIASLKKQLAASSENTSTNPAAHPVNLTTIVPSVRIAQPDAMQTKVSDPSPPVGLAVAETSRTETKAVLESSKQIGADDVSASPHAGGPHSSDVGKESAGGADKLMSAMAKLMTGTGTVTGAVSTATLDSAKNAETPSPVAHNTDRQKIPQRQPNEKTGRDDSPNAHTSKPPLSEGLVSATSNIPIAKSRRDDSNSRPTYVARGKIDDTAEVAPPTEEAQIQIVRAEQLFAADRFQEALPLYERAYRLDPVGPVQTVREHFGYCLIRTSVDRFNEWQNQKFVGVRSEQWDALERDLRQGITLAPRLSEFMTRQGTFEKIARCRGAVATKSDEFPLTPVSAQTHESSPGVRVDYAQTALTKVPFRHLPRLGNWSVIETTNFRIYHRNAKYAEEIATHAERDRQVSYAKWFPGEAVTSWTPACEIYLYPTAREYGIATNSSPQSPGQTTWIPQGGKIVRKIHLSCEYPDIRDAVLPHEMTHAVFAGRFEQPLPRWADEGMAVLTEPRNRQDDHLVNLVRAHRSGGIYSCAQLMSMSDYPRDGRIREFYAESVGLCRYLVEEHGGGPKLIEFMRLALRTRSYDFALQQIYGIQNFAELERGFQQYLGKLESNNHRLAARP